MESSLWVTAIMVEDKDSGVIDMLMENVMAVSLHEAMGKMTDRHQGNGYLVHKVRAVRVSGDISSAHMAEYLNLLGEGKKIAAIKLYREHSGLGLKDAKDYIDQLAADHRV